MKKRLIVGCAGAALAFGGFAGSAGATTQEGLVNVNIDDVTVQVPVAVAANICNVGVNVLATATDASAVDCEADAGSTATVEEHDDGGRVTQRGLVNISATDVIVQVPVSVAANLCNIDINVLANTAALRDATCTAIADASARG